MRAALIFSLLAVLVCVPVLAASAAAEKKPAQSVEKTQKEKPVSLPVPPRFWGQWVFLNNRRGSEFLTIYPDGRMLSGAYPNDDAPFFYTLRIFRDEIGYKLYAIAQEEGFDFDEKGKKTDPFKRWTYLILDYRQESYGPDLLVTKNSNCDTSEFLFLTGSPSLLFDAIQYSCRENKYRLIFSRP